LRPAVAELEPVFRSNHVGFFSLRGVLADGETGQRRCAGGSR